MRIQARALSEAHLQTQNFNYSDPRFFCGIGAPRIATDTQPSTHYKIIKDSSGAFVDYEDICPGTVANTVVPEHKVTWTGGQVVLIPAGPLGKQMSLIGVSLHDQGWPQVRGSSSGATGSTCSYHMNGSTGAESPKSTGTRPIWGDNQIRALCHQLGVSFCAPEWGPKRQYDPSGSTQYEGTGSPYPGDFVRLMHHAFTQLQDVLAYETEFMIGDGDIYATPWLMPDRTVVPSGQDPKAIYKLLWVKP